MEFKITLSDFGRFFNLLSKEEEEKCHKLAKIGFHMMDDGTYKGCAYFPYDDISYKDFRTLEEFIEFVKYINQDIIIRFRDGENELPELHIYTEPNY